MIFVAPASGGIDVTSSSASDEISTIGIVVVLPTRFLTSDELVQVVPKNNYLRYCHNDNHNIIIMM